LEYKVRGHMHVNRCVKSTDQLEKDGPLRASLRDIHVFELLNHAVFFVDG